jgi:hypothetical protein
MSRVESFYGERSPHQDAAEEHARQVKSSMAPEKGEGRIGMPGEVGLNTDRMPREVKSDQIESEQMKMLREEAPEIAAAMSFLSEPQLATLERAFGNTGLPMSYLAEIDQDKGSELIHRIAEQKLDVNGLAEIKKLSAELAEMARAVS